MTPKEFVNRILDIIPAFELSWGSPDNISKAEDGSFSICGVCMELSAYIRDNKDNISHEYLGNMLNFISECCSNEGSDLDNAVCTCFLENLTYEPFSQEILEKLNGRAHEFFKQFMDGGP